MTPYWALATGYLFVAVNFSYNGVGILLPTCVGYTLIGSAAWWLRYDQRVFKFATLPAAILALITFPNLFLVAFGDFSLLRYDWVYWPSIVLEISLMGLVATGLWRETDIKGFNGLSWAAIGTAPIIVITLIAWWIFPATSYGTQLASIFIHAVPAFYLATLNAIFAKSL